jgi:tetratricopeptide (TPR) repeat protein
MDRHLGYYAGLIGHRPIPSGPGIHAGAGIGSTFAELDALILEHPNLRAAIEHAAVTDPHLFAELITSLFSLWTEDGEMRAWLDDALRRGDLGQADRFRCLVAAIGGSSSGRDALWERRIDEADALAEHWGERADQLGLMGSKVLIRTMAGRFDEARKLLSALDADSMTAFERVNAAFLRGTLAYMEGDADEAVKQQERACNIVEQGRFEQGRFETVAAWAYILLAEALLLRGDGEEGLRAATKALERNHPSAYLLRSHALHVQGMGLLLTGHPEQAVPPLLRALALSLPWKPAYNVEIMLGLAFAWSRERPADAAFLYELWRGGFERLSIPPPPMELQAVARWLDGARGAPPESALGRARADAARMIADLGLDEATSVVRGRVLTGVPLAANRVQVPEAGARTAGAGQTVSSESASSP